MTDLGAELGYIIAIALLTKFAEAAEILPDLGAVMSIFSPSE